MGTFFACQTIFPWPARRLRSFQIVALARKITEAITGLERTRRNLNGESGMLMSPAESKNADRVNDCVEMGKT